MTDTDWNITLQTFIQPIELKTRKEKGKIIANLPLINGLTEGPGWIRLSKNKTYFDYPVIIKNRLPLDKLKKIYRSPKTVNPDSNLNQQSINYSTDQYSNLLLVNKNYFFEEQLHLNSKTGTYYAIDKDALSTYYVQSGTCEYIPIKMKERNKDNYIIKIGPLTDQYQNILADGTMIKILCWDAKSTFSMQAYSLRGIANVSIPISHSRNYLFMAQINRVNSSIINLNQ
ncbi:hypothetical protein HDE68_000859 [Pedobacter cryoconitis]|uniref:Uncharacterized protein n=1 Tax=Pedobacter cryoconitis TaxID=188932 RepID=A0A7W9DY91_9SPHI|nr:hypothetical protein [Pedobacter cryoconitis]MBB5634974.1 hypothetical protein [Pedobacter cryoconitis]